MKKKEKQKIKKLLHARMDAWVDSLGDAIDVKAACWHVDWALRVCNEMIALEEKLNAKSGLGRLFTKGA